MKKLFTGALSFIVALSFFACSGNKSANSTQTDTLVATEIVTEEVVLPTTQDNSETSLDWAGVYEGTIPAASGPGIKMTLTLNFDRTFKLVSDYIDEKDGVFTEEGKFTFINGCIVDLSISKDESKFFKVGEGRVIMLDSDMKPAEGALSNEYVLTQKEVFQK